MLMMIVSVKTPVSELKTTKQHKITQPQQWQREGLKGDGGRLN